MKQELYQQLVEVFETFKKEHERPTKKAVKEARKVAQQLKTLLHEYKKASIAEEKAQA